ncbi:hypothetical protein, partial [Klebsiella pneumoniae]|uniref:hypothetical protein n=1 Tax=Klebsiella pneumoniae TaxID=573 RepID=UPI002ED14DB5|nr:hypothetical protein [Klebsiella pneumoniae]
EARRQKADDESVTVARQRIELQTKEIVQAVNERRRADGLEPLGRATVQDYIREAVEADRLSVGGTKSKPLYRLP